MSGIHHLDGRSIATCIAFLDQRFIGIHNTRADIDNRLQGKLDRVLDAVQGQHKQIAALRAIFQG